MTKKKWILLAALCFLLLPWLGETLFNTKGEPREAIVALSMLQQGNWILPTSYGADIPYKPPFLAWLIAIFSLIFNGGVVSEFTSRLPSALAAIAMVMVGYKWACKYVSERTALLMAIVTITSFEVFRAAITCRVDMLLTACMCIALYQMYEWREQNGFGFFRLLGIALLLSGAVLTKGPVGALLPCLAMGIYCLLRGDNFFKSVGWLSAVCIASMILPAIWYVLAYQQGGKEFLDLAMEENVGRITGTMSYESHLNPWTYNVTAVLAGMLPWTILAICALVAWIAATGWKQANITWRAHKQLSNPALFAWTVALIVFIFYCIPASKRSVYLLPMYPFMAFGIARLVENANMQKAVSVYSKIIIVIAIIAPLAGLALQWYAPAKMPIASIPWGLYTFALIPVIIAIYWIATNWNRDVVRNLCILTYSIFLAYAAAFQPIVLNGKTNMNTLAQVQLAVEKEPVYTYLSVDPLMRYYTLNFYLGDRLRLLDRSKPDTSKPFAVLTSPDDAEPVIARFPNMTVTQTEIDKKSCDTRRPILLLQFK